MKQFTRILSLLLLPALAACSSRPLAVYVADNGIRVRGGVHPCLASFEALMAPEPRSRPIVIRNLGDAAGDDTLKLQNLLRGMGFHDIELEIPSAAKRLAPAAPAASGADLRSCASASAP